MKGIIVSTTKKSKYSGHDQTESQKKKIKKKKLQGVSAISLMLFAQDKKL